MIDDLSICLAILDQHITGQNYLEFLQNGLPELEDVPLATWLAVYFQHDRTPSYYTQTVVKHLNDTFSNRIGHGNTINLPTRLNDN